MRILLSLFCSIGQLCQLLELQLRASTHAGMCERVLLPYRLSFYFDTCDMHVTCILKAALGCRLYQEEADATLFLLSGARSNVTRPRFHLHH